MKKIGLLLMFVILMAGAGIAQPNQRSMNPEDMAKRQTAQLKEVLDLNKDQEKKVHELNLKSSKKMMALRDENQGGGFEGMREKMTEIREEQNKEMKKVLTEAQWSKYEKYQEERRSRMNNRPGSGR